MATSKEDLAEEREALEAKLKEVKMMEFREAKKGIDDILRELDETGNAEVFVQRANGKVKYVKELGRWVYWQDDKWHLDTDGYITRKFKEVAEYFDDRHTEAQFKLQLAIQTQIKSYDEVVEEMVRAVRSIKNHWRKCRNKPTIDRSLALAAEESGMTLPYREFDRKGQFLGVGNGVVNLKTGQLVSGDPGYLMMKSCPIAYVADAKCPNWQSFLNSVMEGDAEKVEFLQQIAGSSLVGKTKEKMFVFQGGGSNGKSTFINVLEMILGSVSDGGYKAVIKPEVFTGNVNTPEYYLAKLKGARVIMMSETSAGGVLNDTLVKQVVDSQEGIQAREVREQAFEFAVVGTVMMLTNNVPKVSATDNGTWRRLVLVNFNRKFNESEKDRTLVNTKLKPELEGILAWAVEGAMKYFANGEKFVVPESIQRDTNDWRAMEDKLGSFMEQRMSNDGGTTKLTELLSAYTDWCKSRGQFAGSEKELKKDLNARGIDTEKRSPGPATYVMGWSLRSDSDDVRDHLKLIRSKKHDQVFE